MKVLVTGGTGFVGREILRELHATGYETRLLVRNGQAPAVQELAARYQSEVCEGDVLNVTSIAKAMQGTDAVIHLVGIISEFGNQTFENVHVRATQNLVHAALAASVRRLVHMSALGTRLNAEARYHQTKFAAERIVNESALDWTIFRPSIIYGPEDKFLNLYVRMSDWSPILPVLGPARTVFQPVAVEDVARCFVAALDEPRSHSHIFDLCGPERYTLAEMVRLILTLTGRKSWIVHVPDDLAEPAAWLLEMIYTKLDGKPSPLTRDQLKMLREDNVGEITWTLDLFKLKPVGLMEGLARYLKAGKPEPKPRSRTP